MVKFIKLDLCRFTTMMVGHADSKNALKNDSLGVHVLMYIHNCMKEFTLTQTSRRPAERTSVHLKPPRRPLLPDRHAGSRCRSQRHSPSVWTAAHPCSGSRIQADLSAVTSVTSTATVSVYSPCSPPSQTLCLPQVGPRRFRPAERLLLLSGPAVKPLRPPHPQS